MALHHPACPLEPNLPIVSCVSLDISLHLPESQSLLREMETVTPVLTVSHDRLGGCLRSTCVILGAHQPTRMDTTWRVLRNLGHCIQNANPVCRVPFEVKKQYVKYRLCEQIFQNHWILNNNVIIKQVSVRLLRGFNMFL